MQKPAQHRTSPRVQARQAQPRMQLQPEHQQKSMADPAAHPSDEVSMHAAADHQRTPAALSSLCALARTKTASLPQRDICDITRMSLYVQVNSVPAHNLNEKEPQQYYRELYLQHEAEIQQSRLLRTQRPWTLEMTRRQEQRMQQRAADEARAAQLLAKQQREHARKQQQKDKLAEAAYKHFSKIPANLSRRNCAVLGLPYPY